MRHWTVLKSKILIFLLLREQPLLCVQGRRQRSWEWQWNVALELTIPSGAAPAGAEPACASLSLFTPWFQPLILSHDPFCSRWIKMQSWSLNQQLLRAAFCGDHSVWEALEGVMSIVSWIILINGETGAAFAWGIFSLRWEKSLGLWKLGCWLQQQSKGSYFGRSNWDIKAVFSETFKSLSY